ncbi:MAG: ATP-binding protein [Fibrobacter sp.]|nr:ATP-binding protein [Fibrobacter sp.]
MNAPKFKRECYLKKIRGFYHDCEIIKVITGVRRCGKSSLMETIAQELTESGIAAENIIYLDLDKRGYKNVKTAEQLEKCIEEKSNVQGTKFLFIDEIQNVKNFEEVINAFRGEGDFSIFITGSNSYLLSGELVTKLTGRYIEFEMFPLNFQEYLGMKRFWGKPVSPNLVDEFDNFLAEGGFPKAIQYDALQDKKTYIESVITEIFEKDIKRRVKIRNVSVFEKIRKYMINNFGATSSLTNMLEDLQKDGSQIKRETLNRYIQILVDSKILYECNRFDMKSRKSIAGEKKYYLADVGFYYATNTDNRINYGPVMENVFFTYAKSNGYSISVGRIGKLECDFILQRNFSEYNYVQVCMTMMNSRETEDREFAPLEKIRDNYPKFVLTRNDVIQHRNGIIHKNMPEMMSEGTQLDSLEAIR